MQRYISIRKNRRCLVFIMVASSFNTTVTAHRNALHSTDQCNQQRITHRDWFQQSSKSAAHYAEYNASYKKGMHQ